MFSLNNTLNPNLQKRTQMSRFTKCFDDGWYNNHQDSIYSIKMALLELRKPKMLRQDEEEAKQRLKCKEKWNQKGGL